VQVKDEFYKDKIAAFTKGCRPINNNTIEMKAVENAKIEGFRWSRGFKKGRHVVEFIYPVHLRAPGARVGLGHKTTPLGGTTDEIVGAGETYAIDLMKNYAITNNKTCRRLRSKVLPYTHKCSELIYIGLKVTVL